MQLNSIASPTWITVAAIFGLFELLFQLVLVAVCRFKPIGDEIEYIERGQSANPFRYKFFHRLPVLPSMAKLGAGTGHPVAALRLASVVFSAFAMAATAGAATLVAGPVIATGLSLILLLIPERIVLGSRLWPDVYLAAATSGIALILTLTPSPLDHTTASVLAGILIAFAVLVRLDALILVPATTAAWFGIHGWADPASLVFLIGAPMVAFLAWWLASKVFLGENWPDTTWRFNLALAAEESQLRHGGRPIVIDEIIRHQLVRITTDQEHREPPAAFAVGNFFWGVLSRFHTMVGPDSFIAAKLITDDNSCLRGTARNIWIVGLRAAFPLLLTATSCLFILWPTPAGWGALPSLAMLLPACLLFARNRYRLPALYGMALMASGSAAVAVVDPAAQSSGSIAAALTLAAAILFVLFRKTRRLEQL